MVKTFLLNSSVQTLAIHFLFFLILLRKVKIMAQLSQNKKAKEARRWRYTNSLKKRFDGPLKEYIRIRYTQIYDEYSEFYLRLDKENPKVRDLTKTRMFKEWVGRDQHESPQTQSADESEIPPVHQGSHQESDQEIQQGSDILTATIHETLPQTQSTDESEIPPVHQESHQESDQEIQQGSDILTAAIHETLPRSVSSIVQETLPEGIPEQASSLLNEILPPINHENNVNLEDLINQLEQEEAVRNILDPVVDEMFERYNAQITRNDDEGIELNFMDEIDLQPFDYELEVF